MSAGNAPLEPVISICYHAVMAAWRAFLAAGGSIAFLWGAAAGWAQTPTPPPPPPPNDNRANAQPIARVPSDVAGTTVGATRENRDPSPCGSVTETVWYSLADLPERRVIVRARAQGELDAVVAVYRQARSRLVQVACTTTDEAGRGALAFDVTAASYLVMVGQTADSAPGS